MSDFPRPEGLDAGHEHLREASGFVSDVRKLAREVRYQELDVYVRQLKQSETVWRGESRRFVQVMNLLRRISNQEEAVVGLDVGGDETERKLILEFIGNADQIANKRGGSRKDKVRIENIPVPKELEETVDLPNIVGVTRYGFANKGITRS